VQDDKGMSRDLAGFVAQHSAGLTRFAYVLCGDRGTAEDLVQDAFTALYRRFGNRLPIAAPVAYARQVIVNGHLSRSRRRSSTEAVLAELPDLAADAVDHGAQDEMWRLLSTLPERQRAVLVLRYYLDLTDRDIAAVLSCREGSVRSLAARAFATLRADPAAIRTGGR
jgi:RNA polymerase sigma-70 factor (sigma-E family)